MTEQTQPSAGPEPTATSETESASAIPQPPAEAPAETAERLIKADDEAAAQADATGAAAGRVTGTNRLRRPRQGDQALPGVARR